MSSERGDRLLRIGSRASALALAQAQLVMEAMTAAGRACEVAMIETEGDRRLPDTAWGEGAFVKAIERRLVDGSIDLAAHSAKDVPTDEDPGLAICAYLPRDDPHDALVLAAGAGRQGSLAELRPGAVIGTDSPRRAGFVRWLRPDVEVRSLSGNVDTRLRRLDDGEVDALVLAAAGLRRLGRAERISYQLTPAQLPPAPGQGAIAIQVRADDDELIELGAAIDDLATRRAVEAERAFLRAAGGGCRAPIGALATIAGDKLHLLGGFASANGGRATVGELTGDVTVAAQVAAELVVRLSRRHADLPGACRVLLTRPADQGRGLLAQLALLGISGVEVPAIGITSAGDQALDRPLAEARAGWVIVTSVNGVRAVGASAARIGTNVADYRWAAVGQATAAALRIAGARHIWRPSSAHGRAMGTELPLEASDRLLLVRGDLADGELPAALRRRGAEVDDVVAYRTIEAPPESRPLLVDAIAGPVDAVILASPSAVRGLLSLADADLGDRVRALPAICIGATTAAAAEEAGFTVVGRSATPAAADLAALTAEVLGQPANLSA